MKYLSEYKMIVLSKFGGDFLSKFDVGFLSKFDVGFLSKFGGRFLSKYKVLLFTYMMLKFLSNYNLYYSCFLLDFAVNFLLLNSIFPTHFGSSIK